VWVMPAQVVALFYTTLMFSQLEGVLTFFACYVPSKYLFLHKFNVFPT